MDSSYSYLPRLLNPQFLYICVREEHRKAVCVNSARTV